ncbi:MAG: winged helix-turn-helix transcriptional regulator [Clostridiales bacterium]|nr:winged helix-turn-helix transcriptional regulator [Clostridiales bacterium]
MESVRFHPIDLRLEAAAALMRLAYRGDNVRSGDLRAAAEYYAKKYAVSPERFSGMIEVYEHVKANFTCDETELATLFTVLEGLDFSPYQLVQVFEHELGGERAGSLENRIALILSEDDAMPCFEQAGLADLLAYVQRQPVSNGVKWLFTDAVVRYEAYKARVDRLLDQAEALIREKAALLEPYAKQALDKWSALPDEDAFFDLLAKDGLRLDCRRADVYPLVLQFTSIAVQSNIVVAEHFGEKERSSIYYGVLIDEIDRSERAGRDELESVSGILHALDDKKRLQILTALRERPLYGQELASVTDLSPATVSHHMAELASTGLVTIEKQGVKLLYHLSESRLKEFTAMLENSLMR